MSVAFKRGYPNMQRERSTFSGIVLNFWWSHSLKVLWVTLCLDLLLFVFQVLQVLTVIPQDLPLLVSLLANFITATVIGISLIDLKFPELKEKMQGKMNRIPDEPVRRLSNTETGRQILRPKSENDSPTMQFVGTDPDLLRRITEAEDAWFEEFGGVVSFEQRLRWNTLIAQKCPDAFAIHEFPEFPQLQFHTCIVPLCHGIQELYKSGKLAEDAFFPGVKLSSGTGATFTGFIHDDDPTYGDSHFELDLSSPTVLLWAIIPAVLVGGKCYTVAATENRLTNAQRRKLGSEIWARSMMHVAHHIATALKQTQQTHVPLPQMLTTPNGDKAIKRRFRDLGFRLCARNHDGDDIYVWNPEDLKETPFADDLRLAISLLVESYTKQS